MKKFLKISLFMVLLLVVLNIRGRILSNQDVVSGGSEFENTAQGQESEVEVAVRPTEEITETVTEEPTTEEPTTPEDKTTEVNLVMIGDMLLHDAVQNTGLMPDGTYNYDHLFAHVKQDIQAADVAVVNQEVIIGGADIGIQTYPCFNCREEVGTALVKAGFDVVLHATNHAMDQGEIGIQNCMAFWDQNYPQITYLGLNHTEESSRNIYVYEKDGFKIAMLNYTYGLNGIHLPAGKPYLVNLLDEKKIIEDLQKAEEIADFTIVSPHWGTEYQYTPDSSQEYWAQLFADYGADLVIGTHPHVIEPVEWVEGSGGNKTLVYYSIGNFVSAQSEAPRMLGAMAQVRLEKKEDGTVQIADYGVTPVVTHRRFGCGEMTTYKLSEYTEELAAQNTILQKDASFSIAFMENLCRQVFGDLYVSE